MTHKKYKKHRADKSFREFCALNKLPARLTEKYSKKPTFLYKTVSNGYKRKMIIIEMILMDVFATIFMDLLTGFLVKRKLIHSFIAPEALGRWFLYMFRAKFIHKDIHNTPSLKNEKLWCIISHYLIGIILAGI